MKKNHEPQLSANQTLKDKLKKLNLKTNKKNWLELTCRIYNSVMRSR